MFCVFACIVGYAHNDIDLQVILRTGDSLVIISDKWF